MSSIKEYFKEEGLKEGLEKGIKQGTEQGFKQGAEQGIETVAFNMLKNGESTEKIALYTGLSLEKIELLRKHLLKNQ